MTSNGDQLQAIIAWQADNLRAASELNADLEPWHVWFSVTRDVTTWYADRPGGPRVEAATPEELRAKVEAA